MSRYIIMVGIANNDQYFQEYFPLNWNSIFQIEGML